MRNPEKVLNSLAQHSKNSDYKFERLYRILFNEEMFLTAYQKIYANVGNMTKGSDGESIDGMSLKRINDLIIMLKEESYQPQPSRRTYIPKKNGKRRPLGIPSFNDKLVQEVLRMILQAIYEGQFEIGSHGFRPNKSCHTALLQVQSKFTGVKWFVEGDIKGFYDNINHNTLIEIMRKRIADERFLRLVRKFLNAGYVEDWVFHKTYSGCPQGGIVSPILSNIYLDQLDKFMKEYAESFIVGKSRKTNPEYQKLAGQKRKTVEKLKSCKDEVERQYYISEIKRIEKERCGVSYGKAIDENYKRLQYVRYADDFIVGIIGSKTDCETVKEDIKRFLSEKLQLELSDEKTLITHAQKSARFLGYDIYVRKSNLPKRNKLGNLVRNYGGRVVLTVTTETMRKKLLELGVMKLTYVDGKEIWKSKARYRMKDNDDLEILDTYNSELRGFYNYYSIANNSSIINSFNYMMQYSMYKTYATKYRCGKCKIIEKYHIGKDFGVKYKTKSGQEKVRLYYNEGFKRKETSIYNCDVLPDFRFLIGSTNLIDRLKAGKCEICGIENVPLEIHHIRKLKDLKGKKYWEKFMIGRRRKTIALCISCHVDLHHGKLD